MPAPETRTEALSDYAASVRNALHLSHWTVVVREEPPDDEDAQAEIEPIEGRYRAVLKVARDFWDREPGQQRDTIVHEVLHLALASMVDVVRVGGYRHEVGRAVYDTLWQEFRRQMEYVVDSLTTLVKDRVAPPDWGCRLMPAEPRTEAEGLREAAGRLCDAAVLGHDYDYRSDCQLCHAIDAYRALTTEGEPQ